MIHNVLICFLALLIAASAIAQEIPKVDPYCCTSKMKIEEQAPKVVYVYPDEWEAFIGPFVVGVIAGAFLDFNLRKH